MFFSLIIPVFNRPDEIEELLASLTLTNYTSSFEVVIVEDGSSVDCRMVCQAYRDKLNIAYYLKENTGPGDSRNFGMKMAKGSYFIILDSDCIIPKNYLSIIHNELNRNYVDCFGGADAAHESFSDIQKAINFAMTSFLTTGGIRGGSEKITKFQPRSFNMGISKKAFEATGGFGQIHPGEDPDLSIRLWKQGFETRLISNAVVFHKRRIDWNKFYIQVNKFGKVRPILNSWHPEYTKMTFWFPTVFIMGLLIALIGLFFNSSWLFLCYMAYFISIFILSTVQNKSILIGCYSIVSVFIQFYGYGRGFLESQIKINLLGRKPEQVFPKLFFKK